MKVETMYRILLRSWLLLKLILKSLTICMYFSSIFCKFGPFFSMKNALHRSKEIRWKFACKWNLGRTLVFKVGTGDIDLIVWWREEDPNIICAHTCYCRQYKKYSLLLLFLCLHFGQTKVCLATGGAETLPNSAQTHFGHILCMFWACNGT